MSMHSTTDAMEQTRYWMWARRKLGAGNPHIPSPFSTPTPTAIAAATAYNGSWEEQAFADDSSGRLGGCVWPPRSYSCSFCRREFRSAQALGGHMNVHRRDRARLKQSPPAVVHHHHLHSDHTNPFAAAAQINSSTDQVCTVIYKPDPNSTSVALASPLSPGVSVASTQQENCSDLHTTTTIIHGQRKRPFLFTQESASELKFGGEELSERETAGEGEEEAEDFFFISSGKRQRTGAVMPFLKPTGLIGHHHLHHLQSEVLVLGGHGHDPLEELDLELRLGDPPKVK